jgi:hypothetical protein
MRDGIEHLWAQPFGPGLGDWVASLCDAGEGEERMTWLRRAVGAGYSVAPTLAGSRSFDALPADPGFQQLLAQAEASRQRTLAAFEEPGGVRLLGR